MVSGGFANIDRLPRIHYGAFAVSNTSVTVAFALVVLASPAASFARSEGSAATGDASITTVDPGGAGKCFKARPATAALRNRPGIVHSLCWAPRNDGPEVQVRRISSVSGA
jgi:hypothetical protein